MKCRIRFCVHFYVLAPLVYDTLYGLSGFSSVEASAVRSHQNVDVFYQTVLIFLYMFHWTRLRYLLYKTHVLHLRLDSIVPLYFWLLCFNTTIENQMRLHWQYQLTKKAFHPDLQWFWVFVCVSLSASLCVLFAKCVRVAPSTPLPDGSPSVEEAYPGKSWPPP